MYIFKNEFLSLKIKMSKVESVNFCYICDLVYEARKQFIKHNLSDEHLNRARKEMEDEARESV